MFNLWHIHKPVTPVRLMKLMLLGVGFNLGEVELRSVPATDAVVCAKVPLNGVLICFCLVPLWQQEHVFTILMCKPSYGHFGLQGLIVSGKKFNLELSQDGMGFQLECLCDLKSKSCRPLPNISGGKIVWSYSLGQVFLHYLFMDGTFPRRHLGMTAVLIWQYHSKPCHNRLHKRQNIFLLLVTKE